MRAFRNLEAVVFGELGIGQVAIRVGQRRMVFLAPDIGDALEKQQREDELLVVAGVDEAAQQDGGAPEIQFDANKNAEPVQQARRAASIRLCHILLRGRLQRHSHGHGIDWCYRLSANICLTSSARVPAST